MKKVALEEHFLPDGFDDYFQTNTATLSHARVESMQNTLKDFGERRLATMAENEIDYAVLSLAGPGVQIERDTATATRRASSANDFLAKEIQKNPRRYGGFAHLPMQAPALAADELERCVRELGFKGALINSHTHGRYLDDDAYLQFWERAEDLRAPIYIHPANPVDQPSMYAGRPEIKGAVWGWAVETGTHALRLVFGGIFERYPHIKIILGHMGETLPYMLWRFDSRYHLGILKRKPSEYIRANIAVTTSGVCSDPSLRCAIDSMGLNNVMFSIDYPFEDTKVASRFIDQAMLAPNERERICHANACALLNISMS